MFGLFGRKSGSTPTLNGLDEIKKLIRTQGSLQAGEMIRKAAVGGNLFCQIFLSQAGLHIPVEKRPEHVKRETELYTRLAAENGDAGSQYNLAKLYINKLDTKKEFWSETDIENVRQAKYWHEKAAAQGLPPAIQALKDLECFSV